MAVAHAAWYRPCMSLFTGPVLYYSSCDSHRMAPYAFIFLAEQCAWQHVYCAQYSMVPILLAQDTAVGLQCKCAVPELHSLHVTNISGYTLLRWSILRTPNIARSCRCWWPLQSHHTFLPAKLGWKPRVHNTALPLIGQIPSGAAGHSCCHHWRPSRSACCLW